MMLSSHPDEISQESETSTESEDGSETTGEESDGETSGDSEGETSSDSEGGTSGDSEGGTSGDSEGGTSGSGSEESGDITYTIMLYMCGSDLESTYANTGYGLATQDITEILSASGQPDNVNVIIETGGASSWSSTYGISTSTLGRWHVANGSLVEDAQIDNASMGLSSTFESFLNWGLTSYPADKYGVILWNHGGGLAGVCNDEIYSDVLLNNEVTTALSNVFTSNNLTSKLEWIGYDACLMSVAEVADFNSDYFNYMVASEETEPGYGWDYDSWLPTLYKNPGVNTVTLLSEICDSYVSACATYYSSLSLFYTEYANGYNDATLAVLDLSKMDAFNTAFDAVGGQLANVITSSTVWSSFETLMNSCQRFGASEDSDGNDVYQYDQFDIGHFITNASADKIFNVDGLSALETALNDLVVYNAYGANYSSNPVCGFTMFVAVYGLLVSYNYYTTTRTNYTNWYTLNTTYYGV